jgi:heme-degrading monooxygenase HmoA
MYARVTLLEIDTMRATVPGAVALFEREVLPDLRAQEGYRGVLVLATPEGQAALVSLWDTEDQAEAGAPAGFYAETLQRYVTLFAAPPGRERYEVLVAETPVFDGSRAGPD